MTSKWFEEKENLEQLILIDKLSYEEIGRRYGCTGSNIKKVAKRIGINLPQKRKINECETFNRSKKIHICNECEKEYKHKIGYQKLLDGDSSIMRANYSPSAFKNDILKEQGGVCAICGMKPVWNGKELVFILDHIDGHASNNKRENLRCVCPNCDSQLDTYKSKNKCGERSYYRYHKEEKVFT